VSQPQRGVRKASWLKPEVAPLFLPEQIPDLIESLNLPNSNKHKNHEASRSMNSKYLAVVAVLAVMMIGATALATDDAFADKKRHDDKKKGGYEKSQAVSQVNDCGNGELPLNIGCQNTASQIQGEGNYVATGSAQG
jgi:hypothetical protein